ncbi:MAG: sodium:alanine symporter family protein [Gammaproteobacteria bacterium]|nr:sodium:alanine symporter family protein [Gammaproteobacteria bacterium]
MAGVSTAIHLGGPGALFWMWVSAIFGMSFRLISTYLSLKYQNKDPEHPNHATPMAYLEHFFKDNWKWVPITLAGIIMFKGFITANLIQSNSIAHSIENELASSHLIVGLLMASLVAFVILGGVKKIVYYCVMLTPWMVLLFLGAGLVILASDPLITLSSLEMVFEYAFTPYSVAGGVAGYTVLQTMQYGISRGIFSHASGMGVAPFLHAANDVKDLRDSSYLAALVPIVDTLIVCSITALVVLNQGYWGEYNGAFLTTTSFEMFYGDIGKILIIACLVLFGFTTIINWSYYAERCYKYLGGKKIIAFRWVFISVTFCGPFFPVKPIWSLADILIAILLLVHLLALLYIVLTNRKAIIEALK